MRLLAIGFAIVVAVAALPCAAGAQEGSDPKSGNDELFELPESGIDAIVEALEEATQNLEVASATTCEFPGVQTPPTLSTTATGGVVATVVCSADSNANVVLTVSRESVEYFQLSSRVIGSGEGELSAFEKGEIVAHLEEGAIHELARAREFARGEVVYFKATASAEISDGGAEVPAGERFSDFNVGR